MKYTGSIPYARQLNQDSLLLLLDEVKRIEAVGICLGSNSARALRGTSGIPRQPLQLRPPTEPRH